jgi:hypothetical protein
MRKLLIGLGVLAIVLAAPAHATVDPTRFLAELRHDGIAGTDKALIDNGNWVCEELARHQPTSAVTQGLIGPNDFTLAVAQLFVADAALYLCSQYPGGNPPKGAVAPAQPGIVV